MIPSARSWLESHSSESSGALSALGKLGARVAAADGMSPDDVLEAFSMSSMSSHVQSAGDFYRPVPGTCLADLARYRESAASPALHIILLLAAVGDVLNKPK